MLYCVTSNSASIIFISLPSEVNTVPNFFSHHLFEDKNIDYRELLCIMIKEAIDKIHKEENMIRTNDDEMFKKVTSKDVRNMK